LFGKLLKDIRSPFDIFWQNYLRRRPICIETASGTLTGMPAKYSEKGGFAGVETSPLVSGSNPALGTFPFLE
jgi:hypothetical protein